MGIVFLSLLVSLAAVLVPEMARAGARSLGQGSLSHLESCTNVVVNGDFEGGVSGLAPWVSKGFAVVSDQRVHGGNFAFWMGGYRSADDALFQSVAIPQSTGATLRYWWNMHSLDEQAVVHDRLIVSLRTAGGEVLEELAVLDNTGARDVWTEGSLDLSEFAGMSLVLHFSCLGDSRDVTSFFIDDVELEVCPDAATSTPTSTPTATSTMQEKCFLPLIWRDAAE